MGLGGDAGAWGLQLAALAPQRRCVVLDNRGAGRSEAPDRPFTVRDMAGDVLGVLDAAGVARAHVLGVSLGGAVAQELALAAPDRVASLHLHGTWAGPDPWLRAVMEAFRTARRRLPPEEFVRALLPWVFTARAYAERPELIALVVQHALEHPRPPPLHGYLRQAEAALAHDARARLGAVRCPTLVSVGEEDLLTPPRLARELAALIPGARLAVVPGGGHGALWEVPGAFNALCRAWLAEVEGRSAGPEV
jgi:pimeloyl-ACP methyl ester carboxylesterase